MIDYRIYVASLEDLAFGMLHEIIEEVKAKTHKEEIEFNGRWCDDGGRSVE